MPERRKRLRIPLETEVQLRFPAGGESSRGRVKNINRDGISIAAEMGFAPGSVLELEVVTAADRGTSATPLKATFRVLRTDGESPPFDIAGEILEIDL